MVWKAKTGPKVSSDMDVKYRYLKQYAYIHGSLANVRFEGDMLCMDDKCIIVGHIVNRLRQAYKKGVLPPKDIEYLENLGMVWKSPRNNRKSDKEMSE